ncbi:DUF6880 family protein [Cognatishimia sp. F0-27]|uniref:DUF6880 family protein n=1 Tax=Cognatishimia sp. F0-27 TaxID=2816855 RepID=UPI001D0C531F|nr:DUF6880 family protein [Cognatishimia sp. F0-27]MCC1494701.1 hypothetical protein [Cognatishimia sp. F0-27]
MAGKALNKANLAALGAETLADLLLECVKGDAARQRRVRMALAADLGPEAVAADVRKRFASIRRGRSFISRKTQKTLAKELADLTTLIETRIAPEAPDLGFELLWAQLHLAAGIHERTDDSRGTIGDAMAGTMEAVARLAPTLTKDPEALAEDVFEAVSVDGYGAFDHAVQALADALGDSGLARLKSLAETARAAPLSEADLMLYGFITDPGQRADRARVARDRTVAMILQDVADLQGDVDAWLARYTPEQLTFHTIAPEAAARLLEAGRAQEALRLVEAALPNDDLWLDKADLDAAHFACLEALGRTEDLRAALWRRFETRLCPAALRRHLKLLPDFDDIEAEEAARQHVLAFAPVEAALGFALEAPDMTLAAELVMARHAEIDGEAYEVLTPLADGLTGAHPLAAVLLWRAMIDFALSRARAGRYGHAARHLAACAAADAEIMDYAGHPTHEAYLSGLRSAHGRKSGFWRRVD